MRIHIVNLPLHFPDILIVQVSIPLGQGLLHRIRMAAIFIHGRERHLRQIVDESQHEHTLNRLHGNVKQQHVPLVILVLDCAGLV